MGSKTLLLPAPPSEATKLLLKQLPSRRMRDVIEKRFGLKSGRKKTLDAIGKEYRITRERVRQIEAEALRNFSREEARAVCAPFLQSIEECLRRHGGVMAEPHLFSTLAEARHYPHIALLMHIGPSFYYLGETEHHFRRWAADKDAAVVAEKILANTANELSAIGKPVSKNELMERITRHAKDALGQHPETHVLEALLTSSKLVKSNPYGEYGLADWPSITPSGIRDKAYSALAKAGTPLHFRAVAAAIDAAGWSRRKAHPQTVHNELIKDKRFVLVGRGTYALREWGYEGGTVRDVIVQVLKVAGRPMTKDEITRSVLEKRMVKVPTILLNLQNKSLFTRHSDGTYALAS